MIALLARLAAADRESRESPVAADRALGLLGWDRVVDQLARHCHDRRAASLLRRQRPYADPETITVVHDLADELRQRADGGQWPPLAAVSDTLDLLDRPTPRRLEGSDLVAVAQLAENLAALRDWFLRGQDQLPRWADAAREMADAGPLADALRRAVDRDGQLLDSASPLLARLRRAAGDLEQQVRRSVAKAMTEASRRGWTSASEVTLRGDRFCLPLKAGDRRKVAGIVHDRSQTGQTVYVEPADTVHLANDLAESRLAMGAEESRILLELNQHVDEFADRLADGAQLMLLADRTRAALLWGEARRAQRPGLRAGAGLRVCRGRHPLLEEALEPSSHADRVVPLDLEMPDATRVLVISGPNAGGKSVAMKTVGVLVLLAQCGWDVPAREDTVLPLVRRLFIDLGDEQSIEDSLSSFSAHLTHLQRFLTEADGDSLLLCDEIGSGTDPQEGTALAITVLERLAERGALVIASTHFALLKAAVHDHAAMVNAAMDYDEESLAPLFTLRLGDPGASHAFDIAARVGLDPELLDRARRLVGEERYQLERLLQDLARRAGDLAASTEAAQRYEEAARHRQDELDTRLAGLDRELKQQRSAVRREGEDLVRQWRRKLEQAVREIRSQEAGKAVVQQAKHALDEVSRALPAAPSAPATGPTELRVGDSVRVPHLGLKGRVVEVRGDKVGVLADGLRVSVERRAVELTETTAATDAPRDPTETAGFWTWAQDDPGIPPELDLRGLRGDEAWERVDRLLDRAVPVGLDSVTIVHGMGTGRLRDHLLACLASDPRVAAFHPAGREQSNVGATVIHLHA